MSLLKKPAVIHGIFKFQVNSKARWTVQHVGEPRGEVWLGSVKCQNSLAKKSTNNRFQGMTCKKIVCIPNFRPFGTDFRGNIRRTLKVGKM